MYRQQSITVHIARVHRPFSGLPGQEERSSKDSIRVLPGESTDSFMEAFQRNATVLVGHVGSERAIRQPSQVCCRQGKQSMHDKAIVSPDLQEAKKNLCKRAAYTI